MMKPLDGRYQTATQVKGLSLEKLDVKEVDSVHVLEDSKRSFVTVRSFSLFRGLRPWYDIAWNLQELGRPIKFSGSGIFVNNPERRGHEEDFVGVGLTHIRGVAEVMLCECTGKMRGILKTTHPKGSAVICKGERRHD